MAARSAKFFSGAVRVGMAPDGGSSVTLTQLVGLRQALRILLTNPTLGADEAADMGLITEVVEDGALTARTEELAAQLRVDSIRCTTAEFRVYARHYPKTGWSNVSSQAWRSLYATNQSRHTLAIARGGVCDAAAPRMTVAKIIEALRDTPIKNYE